MEHLHISDIQRIVLTLMSILPFRLFGLGSVLESPLRTSPTSNLSPKISLRYWAIFFCCWMVQWFSMDRITGYLRRWRVNVRTRATRPGSSLSAAEGCRQINGYSYNWRKLRCFSVTFIHKGRHIARLCVCVCVCEMTCGDRTTELKCQLWQTDTSPSGYAGVHHWSP